MDSLALINGRPDGHWRFAVPPQPSAAVRVWPCGVDMVATRGRDYDLTGPRTRLQEGPAGAARRLVPSVSSPQRLRRTRRMSTHPDVDHYHQDGANGAPGSDTPAPVVEGAHAGPDDAAAGAAPRRVRKNPRPRYIPPGSRAAVSSGSGAGDGHPSPADSSEDNAVCCWGGYGPSANQTASPSPLSGVDVHPPVEDTSSAVDDIEPVASSAAILQPPVIAPLVEEHDGRSSQERRVDRQQGSAGPAALPPAPAQQAVLAPEFPAGLFEDVKPQPVLHAAGVSTAVIPSNEVVAKREAFWAAAAAAATPVPGRFAHPSSGQGGRAERNDVRPRFVASQRPLIAMARASSAGPADGDVTSDLVGKTPDGGARGGADAADAGGASGHIGARRAVGDSAGGDAKLKGSRSR